MSPEPENVADILGLRTEKIDAQEREKHPERSFYWKAAVFVPIPVFMGWCWMSYLTVAETGPYSLVRSPQLLLFTSALWSNAATVSCFCAWLSFKRKEGKADVALYAAIPLLVLAILIIGAWTGKMM